MAILTEERSCRGEYKTAMLIRAPTRETVSNNLNVRLKYGLYTSL